jgi:hypothetical protein
VIRADSLEALWPQVRQVTALVKSARAGHDAAKGAAAPASEAESPEGWCVKHKVQMTLQRNERGSWYSHKTAEGWCRGK